MAVQDSQLLEMVERVLHVEPQGRLALIELQKKRLITQKEFLRITTDRRQKRLQKASQELYDVLSEGSGRPAAFIQIVSSLRACCTQLHGNQASCSQESGSPCQRGTLVVRRTFPQERSQQQHGSNWAIRSTPVKLGSSKIVCKESTKLSHCEDEVTVCFPGRDFTVDAGLAVKLSFPSARWANTSEGIGRLLAGHKDPVTFLSAHCSGTDNFRQVGVRGYGCEFIPALPERLLCGICRFGLEEPVQLICSHRFCRACVSSVSTSSGQRPVCPVDNCFSYLDEDLALAVADGECSFELSNWQVSCIAAHKGCHWQGRLLALNEHLMLCPERLISCPNDCGAVLCQDEVAEHSTLDREDGVLPCEFAQHGCPVKTKQPQMDKHKKKAATFHVELLKVSLKERNRQLERASFREQAMKELLLSSTAKPQLVASGRQSFLKRASACFRRSKSISRLLSLSSGSRHRQEPTSNCPAGLAAAAFRGRCYSH